MKKKGKALPPPPKDASDSLPSPTDAVAVEVVEGDDDDYEESFVAVDMSSSETDSVHSVQTIGQSSFTVEAYDESSNDELPEDLQDLDPEEEELLQQPPSAFARSDFLPVDDAEAYYDYDDDDDDYGDYDDESHGFTPGIRPSGSAGGFEDLGEIYSPPFTPLEQLERGARVTRGESTDTSSARSFSSISSSSASVIPGGISNTGGGSDPKRITVAFNGEDHTLRVPLTSFEDFLVAVREQLGIASPMTLRYFDAELDLHVTLRSLEEMPPERFRLQVTAQPRSWWGFAPDATWSEKQTEHSHCHFLQVREGTKVHSEVLLEKFLLMAGMVGLDPVPPARVFAISNARLLRAFEHHRDVVYGRHRTAPQVFKRDDWKELRNAAQRRAYTKWLQTFAARFPWNDDPAKPPVVAMIHNTSTARAWQICQHGFRYAHFPNEGPFGRGIYLTSKYEFAHHLANVSLGSKREQQVAEEGEGKAFIMCVVLPGNPYPVSEDPEGETSLKGTSCHPGYQSHFSLVAPAGGSGGGGDYPGEHARLVPVSKTMDRSVNDVLVAFEPAQVLPVFVFLPRKPKVPQ